MKAKPSHHVNVNTIKALKYSSFVTIDMFAILVNKCFEMDVFQKTVETTTVQLLQYTNDGINQQP